ncbi:MAG: DNA-directed RNA polymerase subunit D [Candidatus Micrarchaeia archaeon]
MKLEITKRDENECDFVLKGVSTSFANAIRRSVMGKVPILAIDVVTFYENSSALFDEFIANRLGLLPIITPEDYTEKDEVVFMLDKEGPCTVYSGDLKSTDKKVRCAYDNIPIIKLLEGQRLRLEAKARLGLGRKHAKFQPALISYSYDEKNETYQFHAESFGNMPIEKVIMRAVDILEKKCDSFIKEVEEIA